MKSEQTSKKFYKQLGAKGLAKLVSSRRREDIWLVKKMSKKTDKILDLACGFGRITLPLAKAGYNIIGIDLSPNLIKEARFNAKKLGLKVCFDIGSMLRLPYKNESFDKIFCLWSSFNHLLTKKDQVKALNEMFRVLRDNCLAFIEMTNGEAKKISKKLKKEGKGHSKRLWGEFFSGIKNVGFVHSRKTLYDVCCASKFKKFNVCFKNLYGKRRIVVFLYK